jgi:hypothetical protein
MLTPKREKEIREMIRPTRTYDCEESEALPELLAEIDYLRDAFLDMGFVKNNLQEKLAVAVEALEKIRFQSVITTETGPLIKWAMEALSKIRGDK